MTSGAGSGEVVVIRRHIRADPERVFAAFTEPEQLLRWWGPPGTDCTEAHIDLRIGGQFRLANKLPDGTVVWISGTYEELDPPHRLRHTWLIDAMPGAVASTVSVTFEPDNGGTEVVVRHEKIAGAELRDSHESGWIGCLDGLASLLGSGPGEPSDDELFAEIRQHVRDHGVQVDPAQLRSDLDADRR